MHIPCSYEAVWLTCPCAGSAWPWRRRRLCCILCPAAGLSLTGRALHSLVSPLHSPPRVRSHSTGASHAQVRPHVLRGPPSQAVYMGAPLAGVPRAVHGDLTVLQHSTSPLAAARSTTEARRCACAGAFAARRLACSARLPSPGCAERCHGSGGWHRHEGAQPQLDHEEAADFSCTCATDQGAHSGWRPWATRTKLCQPHCGQDINSKGAPPAGGDMIARQSGTASAHTSIAFVTTGLFGYHQARGTANPNSRVHRLRVC